MVRVPIDVTFDVRTDAAGGDPDSTSPTLRAYHQALWSKPLPNGRVMTLDTTTPWTYLHHASDLGEFWLSSDSVIASYSTYVSRAALIAQVGAEIGPDVVAEFDTIGYTIGGMMIFPSNRIDNKPTLNMARGTSRATIGDRMDLTLECIRRFYAGDQTSPLGPTIARYRDFFTLFETFQGYVEFFLLQDLTTDHGQAVDFFLPFDDFRTHAIPNTLDTYDEFRRNSIRFVQARNARIAAWSATHEAAPDQTDNHPQP